MPDLLADITYIVRQKRKPYYESSAITGMVPKLHFKTVTKKVLIKDIRDSKNLFANKFITALPLASAYLFLSLYGAGVPAE